MKMLLTSGGVTNPSIRQALVELVGKSIDEATALCIPSAEYGHPHCTPETAYRFVAGVGSAAMTNLGWKSVGLLELLALPGMAPERWMPWVRAADVLLVDGGEATYLRHLLRESGVAARFPELTDTVWVGVSAGSMVMTPRIGAEFLAWDPDGDDRTLGLVDFSIFPHLDHPDMPENTLLTAERWASALAGPAYAIDDSTAIVVDGDRVEVVSEGTWKKLR